MKTGHGDCGTERSDTQRNNGLHGFTNEHMRIALEQWVRRKQIRRKRRMLKKLKLLDEVILIHTDETI